MPTLYDYNNSCEQDDCNQYEAVNKLALAMPALIEVYADTLWLQ